MSDSRISLSTTALAVLSFVLAYFGYVELLFLLIAYAVFLDKNQKLTKISFQALYLQLAYRVVLLVLGWIFGFVNWFFGLFDAYRAINFFGTTHGYIRTILSILIFVAYLLGVFQVIKKQDCNLPILSSLADKTLGIITPKAPKAAPVYQQPAPAASVPQYQPPQQPQQAPYQAPPAAPAPAPAAPAASAAPAADQPASWTCSCGHDNTGNFCMKCGNKRP